MTKKSQETRRKSDSFSQSDYDGEEEIRIVINFFHDLLIEIHRKSQTRLECIRFQELEH